MRGGENVRVLPGPSPARARRARRPLVVVVALLGTLGVISANAFNTR